MISAWLLIPAVLIGNAVGIIVTAICAGRGGER